MIARAAKIRFKFKFPHKCCSSVVVSSCTFSQHSNMSLNSTSCQRTWPSHLHFCCFIVLTVPRSSMTQNFRVTNSMTASCICFTVPHHYRNGQYSWRIRFARQRRWWCVRSSTTEVQEKTRAVASSSTRRLVPHCCGYWSTRQSNVRHGGGCWRTGIH